MNNTNSHEENCSSAKLTNQLTHKTTKRIKKSSNSHNQLPTPSSSTSRKRPFDSISLSHLEDEPNSFDKSNHQHQHTPLHHHHHHRHHHHQQQQQQPNHNQPNNNQFNHHHHHHHHHHHQQPPPQQNQSHNSISTEEDFPMIRCGWNDCRQGFWILEDLINHLVGENGHVPPDPTAPRGQKCPCEWTGCPKQGKPQGSRMALLVHLRSHTGEKPFSCHRPECDKTFSRTDALAKHVRVSHGEILPSLRSSSNNNPNTSLKASSNSNSSVHNNVSGKKIKAENESEEEDNEENNQTGVGGGPDKDSNQKPEKELIEIINENGKCFNEFIDSDLRTEEERKSLEELKSKLPSNDFAFLEFLVLKAKIKFALGEREIMKSELNSLKNKEKTLENQKDLLLDKIMKNKIGIESSDLWRSSIENNIDDNDNKC